jgi:hypothetical protein
LQKKQNKKTGLQNTVKAKAYNNLIVHILGTPPATLLHSFFKSTASIQYARSTPKPTYQKDDNIPFKISTEPTP